MIAIPFDNELRNQLGLPQSAQLLGPRSHCIRAQTTVTVEPLSDPARACDSLDLVGPARILLVDDLMVHSECSAAYELASFLAASLRDFPHRDSRLRLDENDIGVVVFLRLTAAMAAIQGGLYRRAYTTLLQARQLSAILTPSSLKVLLMGSLHGLLCRLAQVEGLPARSLEHLEILEETLYPDRMIGSSLFRARSELDDSAARAFETLVDSNAREEVHNPDHVFGSYAPHYLHYLFGRILIQLGQWEEAEEELRLSVESLQSATHAGSINPLRQAFVKVALARAKVGKGKSKPDGIRDVDEGRKDLREGISLFRRLNFTPGEYLSAHYLAETDRAEHATAESVRAYKELHDLARRSGVLRFQLEAAVAYAKEVFAYGRPNAAHAALGPFTVEPPEFAKELARDPLWKRADTLYKQTESARENGVCPREPWGLSRYAEDERDFVLRVSDAESDSLVSVYGPPGSGRRILLERIARARKLLDTKELAPFGLSVVTAVRRSPRDVEQELSALFSKGTGIVLYDLDVWEPEAQRRAFQVIQQLEDAGTPWRKRLFVTLTERLERAESKNRVVPAWIAVLNPRYTWNIEPLERRPQDTLLLARGFLVHALIARHAFANDNDAKLLIFTSESARHIRETCSHIGALFRAMRSVASGIRIEFDVFDATDKFTSYKKVPLEVIRRLLPYEPEIDVGPQRQRTVRDAQADAGESDIMKADAATIRELAIRYDGKLAVLAEKQNVPRSTLIRAWKTRGVLDIWYSNGGRKTRAQARNQEN